MKTYVGTFNFQGESYRLRTEAHNEEMAFFRFIGALSKKLSLARRALLYHFNGSKDNYSIMEELK